ncbi:MULTISPECIES: DNA-directed RNA polymerase subunit omega [Helicobacter]|uniref:DNA-directed RNA polymerase subunit omega n=2 Tax=Helicobacter typhlonius TaxID=76936 RepID=A0A099UDY4_9HELI|nr:MULTISPECIES: DNA-directed RNA polymerase subunit omega [Helicobacter]TLD78348.1 DNA-directed RNA polymerase subunit omega [Helicobacter typhlonius]TLD87104.1 DNA-directed RNA polymerase subunit omega [Helicobacter sp. MIT 03-1616]CUU39178.1 DNA-directed RNA polymerase omega subunit [Helicobacter typhlonius]HCD73060.1 DNA-directed RNA polymerase subunit omega [Helicobacter sp.]
MDTLRTEEIAAKALKRVNDDRYVLASLIFERVKELGEGAKPLIDADVKKDKLPDIAMREIAEGKIELTSIEDKE